MPRGKWLTRVVVGLLLIAGTIVVGRAFQSRTLPPLEAWHRLVPAREVTAADIGASFTLGDYVARETAVFDEVQQALAPAVAGRDPSVPNRYVAGSVSSPRRSAWDGNRTYERVPAEIRGGALLIHGLTDAPYSLHSLAEHLASQGVYALALRMPGHGTVPGGLTSATWEDWMAAVRMGVRHVRQQVPAGKPVCLVGYSNGGALAVKYALDTLIDPRLVRPDRLLLISPMIGVSPAARLAWMMSVFGGVPYFEQSKWLDVLPEYLPFKYTSFPVNAARQTYRLTSALDAALSDATADGRIGRLPPILTFQSLVDTTVRTDAVVDTLYARLGANGSELVIFDVNRQSRIQSFFKAGSRMTLPPPPRRYRLTVITNLGADSLDVVARTTPPEASGSTDVALGLAWPRNVFSLTHIALPFAPDDPVFGAEVDGAGAPSLRLGALEPRGERQLLIVPVEQFMRLTYNPFYSYFDSRAIAWLAH